MDDRSACSVGLSGRIHDHFRITLIGNYHQKLVFGILQSALLSFFKFLAFNQKPKLSSAADAADRNNKRNSCTGDINLNLIFQSPLQFLPFLIRYRRKEHGFLRSLQSEGVQDFRGRCSPPQCLECYRHPMFPVKSQKPPRLVSVANGHHKI